MGADENEEEEILWENEEQEKASIVRRWDATVALNSPWWHGDCSGGNLGFCVAVELLLLARGQAHRGRRTEA
jgi:hypothetical protein